jgi:hypothetical protein
MSAHRRKTHTRPGSCSYSAPSVAPGEQVACNILLAKPGSGGRELSQAVESCSHKHRLDTGCQHTLSFSQALGKIADHIDIRIPETFGFLANERAPARDVLNNLPT